MRNATQLVLVTFTITIAVGCSSTERDVADLTPMPVGAGPLLFFVKPDESSDEQLQLLYVIDPETSRKPRPVFATPGNVHVRHRIGQQRIVLYIGASMRESPTGYFLFDLEKGSTTRLSPESGRGVTLLEINGATLYFLERQQDRPSQNALTGREEDDPLLGAPLSRLFAVNVDGDMKLTWMLDKDIMEIFPGDEQHFWIVTGADTSQLWLLAKDGSAKKRIMDRVVRVVAIEKEYFLVVANATAPELWRVSMDGRTKKKLLEMDADCDRPITNCSLSPTGKYAALGAVGSQRDLGLRNLVVYDLRMQEQVYELKNIRVGSTRWTEPREAFYFIWLDDERIRFSESVVTTATLLKAARRKKDGVERSVAEGVEVEGKYKRGVIQWVDVNVKTKRRLREHVYRSISSISSPPTSHHMPTRDHDANTNNPNDDPFREEIGFFKTSGGRLYFRGESDIVGDITDGNGMIVSAEMAVSPEGKWAAFMSEKNQYATVLVNGKTQEKQVVMHGWCRGFKWLPDVK